MRFVQDLDDLGEGGLVVGGLARADLDRAPERDGLGDLERDRTLRDLPQAIRAERDVV
jgi:hypothetical protein